MRLSVVLLEVNEDIIVSLNRHLSGTAFDRGCRQACLVSAVRHCGMHYIGRRGYSKRDMGKSYKYSRDPELLQPVQTGMSLLRSTCEAWIGPNLVAPSQLPSAAMYPTSCQSNSRLHVYEVHGRRHHSSISTQTMGDRYADFAFRYSMLPFCLHRSS